ncbi:MAG: G1 family glutamic endopeptidase [Nitrolancea sp.]
MTAATPASSPSAIASPSSDVVAAIKQVIQRANEEQEQALAENDPTLMQDTASQTYYNELLQEMRSLQEGSVTSIHLENLDWGPITIDSAHVAHATTTETWTTNFGSGSSLAQTNVNVYTLVLESGTWTIQSDQYPDTRSLQSPGGSTSQSGTPAPNPAPSTGSEASENWAGYVASGGSFIAVSGTWVVPNVDASAADGADATWVGIGGVTSTDLIQAGTDAIVQGGQVTYAALLETLPEASETVPLTISPGDTVSVSITQQTQNTWQIVMKDVTTSQTYQTTVQYQSQLSSAEWIEESPSTGRQLLLPLDSFGSITFTNCSAVEDGQSHTIAQMNVESITLQTPAGKPLVTTSELGSDGASFSVTRTNVPAPMTQPGGRRFHGGG